MAISLQRLTLFALLTEFESDCRQIIAQHVLPERQLSELVGTAAYEAIVHRANAGNTGDVNDVSLLPFLDIGDAIKSLLASKSLLPKECQQAIASSARTLEAVPSIRNRVMHRRPVLFEDLPVLMDLCRTVVRRSPKEWSKTASVVRGLDQSPTFATAYGQFFEAEDASTVLHNLPAPEFEDTGFLGRREQIEELNKAIRGPYPVITILGVGGVGKTALAVHAAYALVERTDCPFDAIIWTSAKTTRLTRADIEHIGGAIKDSIGIASSVLEQFGVSNTDDPFKELLELLGTFKVLLFIDNLETVLDQRIRDFVRDVPGGSKIVFTSRIGLGAFDFTVPLGSLPGKESDSYFRRVASVWHQQGLATLPADQVKAYCTRLNNNPLGIKWFVQAVAAGASPQSLVANPETLLRFCLENILDKLSSDAKKVLEILAVTGRSQTPASITFISDLETSRCQEALRGLFTSNLISISAGQIGYDDHYRITPIALTYISRHFSPSVAQQENIRKRQSALNKLETEADIRPDDQFVYDPSFIVIRKECAGTDAVAAGFLRRASGAMRSEKAEEAFGFLEEAKNVAPNYFEVLRVEGFVAAQSGNIMRAKAAYEEAVALRPDHPPLRVWYAGFLLRYLDDPDEAIAQLEVAFKHDPLELLIPIELARSYLHLQDYDKVISILDGVDLTRSKNARLTRVYHDLVIQVHVRRADRTLDTGEAEPFVDDAEALRRHVSTLPNHVVDSRITRHIRHMIGLIRRFMLRENGSPLGVRAEGVLNSLSGQFEVRPLPVEAVDGRFSGRVINLPAQQTFGFLEKGDGSRLFFHKGSFLLPGAFESLELGDEVTFEMGNNAQGECAVKLMPVSFDAPVLERQVVLS